MSNRVRFPLPKRRIAPLAPLLLVALAAGCRTAPLLQVDPIVRPIDHGVETAIAVGARRAGWRVEGAVPGAPAVDVKLPLRPEQFAIVRIDFGGSELSFRYLGSHDLRCDPTPDGDSCTRIHRRYNDALRLLRDHIAEALQEPPPPPINEQQALATIRQLVEEQPDRYAYTAVDVSPQRVAAIRHEVQATYFGDPFYDPWPWYYRPYYGNRLVFYNGPFFYDYTVSVREYDRSDVVYFNNVSRVELRPRGRWQMVQIYDRFGDRRMRLFTLDENLAKRFVYALGVMEDARAPAAPAPGEPAPAAEAPAES